MQSNEPIVNFSLLPLDYSRIYFIMTSSAALPRTPGGLMIGKEYIPHKITKHREQLAVSMSTLCTQGIHGKKKRNCWSDVGRKFAVAIG